MKSATDAEDLRLWSIVAATVRPLPGRVALSPPPPAPSPAVRPSAAPLRPSAAYPRRPGPPQAVDASLHRRLSRGREHLAARIDLHGLTHDAARAALTSFILRSAEDGWRAALVITGKGTQGGGLLRRLTPEWLAAAPLREYVAGISEAHRRHGGEGALYVALKRRR